MCWLGWRGDMPGIGRGFRKRKTQEAYDEPADSVAEGEVLGQALESGDRVQARVSWVCQLLCKGVGHGAVEFDGNL